MLAELDMLNVSKSDDEDLRSLDDQNTNESLTSLLIDGYDKDKNRDANTCITYSNDESPTIDCTLSASICQKGEITITFDSKTSTITFFENVN